MCALRCSFPLTVSPRSLSLRARAHSYVVMHVRRGDKAAYASGHHCSYLRANCSKSSTAGGGGRHGKRGSRSGSRLARTHAAAAAANKPASLSRATAASEGNGMRALSSAAASPDLFLHDRTWEALRTIVLAEPSLPWMLISDSRDTAEQARRRLSQITKGAARFIQPKCNGSSLASAAPMAAMSAGPCVPRATPAAQHPCLPEQEN